MRKQITLDILKHEYKHRRELLEILSKAYEIIKKESFIDT